MPGDRIVVIGGGGHAKVIIELIRSRDCGEIVGVTEPRSALSSVLGVPVLGDDSVLPELLRQGVAHAFVAIGDNRVRRQLARKVEGLGFGLLNAISRSAIVSPSARIGRGVAIMSGAIVNADAQIEDLAIVNTGAVIDHDCRLGLACHVAPGAVLAGGVVVGDEAFIGAGATVIPGRTIGSAATVGAGAAVIRDVDAHTTVVGVPARRLPAGDTDD